MNNKIVSAADGRTYVRLNKIAARNSFDSGVKIYVMSIDRNPIDSVTTAHEYKKGCKPLCAWLNEKDSIDTFGELLEDFSEWLDTDGYGHIPDRYAARHYKFSYWRFMSDENRQNDVC